MNDVVDAPAAGVTVLFCSTSENIGRTTAIINVALVLAGAGHKVLLVDAHRSTIRADYYLRPFMASLSPLAGEVSPVSPPRPESRTALSPLNTTDST